MRPKFRFRPQAKGLATVLGGREAEIMEALWREAPVSVSQVHRELSRRQKVAYTTIMTIMSRMAQKGLLVRVRSGNAYLYSPPSLPGGPHGEAIPAPDALTEARQQKDDTTLSGRGDAESPQPQRSDEGGGAHLRRQLIGNPTHPSPPIRYPSKL